ncbi:MAG: aldehyde dehydrogenase family protein [Gemmatimonadales bacterium]|nr:MAG: aldehyde dehydrogenase family protein [Gemmatimonadales bacterium]
MEYGPAPESARPAIDWLEHHGRRFQHFIGGSWVEPESGETFETRSPADHTLLAQVALGTPADLDRAVAAARAAHPEWEALGGPGRARHLYALARAVQRHARLFAVLESLDNGKPIRESRDLDIPLVARHFYHHAGWAQLLEREFPGARSLGVAAQIIPWNFPLLMLAWKVAPAIAAGNTVVLKPAEHTPLTALLFGEICGSVGLPDGVVNIVTGAGETGAALVDHPDIDKVAFTGSTDVGRAIRKATAGRQIPISLELGGKSPFIVHEEADLDSVVEGVVDAIWFNQGQVCCAGSRILVQESVAATLEAKLKARMERLRMGHPLDKSVDMGAIVAPVQLESIRRLVDEGRDEGARIWQPSWATPEEGLFYPPTLCTDVEPAGTLAQEEIFGPVVVLMSFRTPDEAVALANDTRYGLAASIWSENLNVALDLAPRIRAGTVWVNCTNLFDAASGFGGVRESGFGREGGREGFLEYLRQEGMAPAPPDGPDLSPTTRPDPRGPGGGRPGLEARSVDRTSKLWIGGKQARPDGGCSLGILDREGSVIAEVPAGNRKDIRNAVEAARKALPGWSSAPAHLRAQILFYAAENLSQRAGEWALRLEEEAGIEEGAARAEVEATVDRFFHWASMADKWDGRIHGTPFRNVTLAMHEPVGIIGIAAAREAPLLGLVSALAPAIAMGNTVVALPSERAPSPGLDLHQVLETSDLPAGVVNLVTGTRWELLPVLADHDAVDAVWSFGTVEERAEMERRSVGNLKRTWAPVVERAMDWLSPDTGASEAFARQATEVKNIWVPYGA